MPALITYRGSAVSGALVLLNSVSMMVQLEMEGRTIAMNLGRPVPASRGYWRSMWNVGSNDVVEDELKHVNEIIAYELSRFASSNHYGSFFTFDHQCIISIVIVNGQAHGHCSNDAYQPRLALTIS